VLKIAGIAAAVLLLGALATGYYFLSVKESAVAELRGRFKELKPRMEQVLQTEKKVALASQWGPARVPLTDLLLEITTLFPPEAYVTTMTVDESGLVRINGRSKTNQVMSKLVTSLNGSRTFANASLGAVTKNNAKDEFKYDYSITVQIRGQAPEKTNGEKAKGKV
jgi:Tfp pilus assembly protein PilN